MRRVIASVNLTLDGFMAGTNGELDWHFPLWNEEMSAYSFEQLSMMDTILLGRISYQLMADYWPYAGVRPLLSDQEAGFARMMNNHRKVVFSRTLDKLRWKNSELVRRDIQEEIWRMKQLPGKDMIIYGSGSIVNMCMQQGLIDEFRLWVHPVTLERGIPLFQDELQVIKLKFLKTRSFSTGVVIFYYC